MFHETIPADIHYSSSADRLNEAQKSAVITTEGPLLILAGAGTGKTSVLTERIAHILLNRLALPQHILAVTFTNKAAKEMQHRVDVATQHQAQGIWLGTFHAIAARMLRRHAEHVGLKSSFSIIDVDDQVRLLKQIIIDKNIDEKRWTAKSLAALISRWKDQGLLPEEVPLEEGEQFAYGKGISAYKEYQQRLLALGAVDFGDLLLYNVVILRKHPEILAEYHQRFHYILVDEYQDTNTVQYLWLRLLAQYRKNICCVGDDDQSIYGWRGAQLDHILQFSSHFDNATVIRLEQNYRSTPHILGAASSLIACNNGRLGKTLWTTNTSGEKVSIRGYYNDKHEAESIANEIDILRHNIKHALKEIAVLVRAGHQTRSFEEAFLREGLPYRVVGSLRFYDRREIKDAIAYMRVLVEPNDNLAFERIINVPKRSIGKQTLQNLYQIANEARISLFAATQKAVADALLPPRIRTNLQYLTESFVKWSKQCETQHFADIVENMLHESGYIMMWQAEKTEEAKERLENLQELLRALRTEYENLPSFLEHVSLVSDKEGTLEGDVVQVMTLHAAKGLEFETVFLPGWEEGLFPSQRSINQNGDSALEEERRLGYVGITRAKKRSYISCAQRRFLYNQAQDTLPSRFIYELPHEHVVAHNIILPVRPKQSFF